MNQQHIPMVDDNLVREAEMVANHYLNEFTQIDISAKARLVLAIMFPDPGVAERLQKELGCTKEEADILWLDTKFWLWFCKETDKPVCPSAALDEGWHTFILFTRQYQEFCKNILGRFIHHTPHVGDAKPDPEAGKAMVDYTCKQAKRLFNAEHLSANWQQLIAAYCHDKCKGCNDAKCHGGKKAEGCQGGSRCEQGHCGNGCKATGEKDLDLKAKAESCSTACGECSAPAPLQKLQLATGGDCCEKCSGSTNCQD